MYVCLHGLALECRKAVRTLDGDDAHFSHGPAADRLPACDLPARPDRLQRVYELPERLVDTVVLVHRRPDEGLGGLSRGLTQCSPTDTRVGVGSPELYPDLRPRPCT